MVVRRISEPELIDDLFRLRAIAWATEGVSFPDALGGRVFDPVDVYAEHFGIVEDGKVVAAARVSYHATADTLPLPDGWWYSKFEYPVALLSRLVVHPDSRRRGYGSLLTVHIAAQAAEGVARNDVAYVSAPCVDRVLSESGFSRIGNVSFPWGDSALDASIRVRARSVRHAP
jgi:GNAT superfamily N-acetyltransferase